jgi:hypothetical protein
MYWRVTQPQALPGESSKDKGMSTRQQPRGGETAPLMFSIRKLFQAPSEERVFNFTFLVVAFLNTFTRVVMGMHSQEKES